MRSFVTRLLASIGKTTIPSDGIVWNVGGSSLLVSLGRGRHHLLWLPGLRPLLDRKGSMSVLLYSVTVTFSSPFMVSGGVSSR